MKLTRVVRIFAVLAFVVMAMPARSEEKPESVSPSSPPSVQVPSIRARLIVEGKSRSLQWVDSETFVRVEAQGGKKELFVELKGRALSDWVALWQGKKLSSSFSVRVPIQSKVNPVPIYAVNSLGEVDRANAAVVVPDFDRLGMGGGSSAPRRYSISPSLGLSFINYSQSEAGSISSKAVTGKLALQYYVLPPRWDAGIVAYMTVVPMSSDLPGTSLRFIGINARVGYHLSRFSEPWRVTLMGGLYYTSMTASDGAFGFQGLMGPQIYPVVRRVLASGDTVSGYLKYAMVGNSDSSLVSFGNREIAGGAVYGHLLGTGKPLLFTLDLANLQFTHTGTQISSSSMSFGVGYSF